MRFSLVHKILGRHSGPTTRNSVVRDDEYTTGTFADIVRFLVDSSREQAAACLDLRRKPANSKPTAHRAFFRLIANPVPSQIHRAAHLLVTLQRLIKHNFPSQTAQISFALERKKTAARYIVPLYFHAARDFRCFGDSIRGHVALGRVASGGQEC